MVQTRLHKHSLSKKEQAVSSVASRASVRDPIDEFQDVYGSRAASAAFRQQIGSDFSRSPQFQPPIQAKPSFRGLSQELAAESQPVQLREEENKTGLPDDLKAGVEALSGFSMDDVRVHYNSSKPAQLQALAYTQGTEIHVGPGQEKHLAHEAWHVVQQMQGRVRPNAIANNREAINTEENLEREASLNGEKAHTVFPFQEPADIQSRSLSDTHNPTSPEYKVPTSSIAPNEEMLKLNPTARSECADQKKGKRVETAKLSSVLVYQLTKTDQWRPTLDSIDEASEYHEQDPYLVVNISAHHIVPKNELDKIYNRAENAYDAERERRKNDNILLGDKIVCGIPEKPPKKEAIMAGGNLWHGPDPKERGDDPKGQTETKMLKALERKKNEPNIRRIQLIREFAELASYSKGSTEGVNTIEWFIELMSYHPIRYDRRDWSYKVQERKFYLNEV